MSGFAPRFLPNEASTLALGEQLARAYLHSGFLEQGFVIALHGDLGAGKTTLVRGVLRGLGYSGRVKSPTYPLLETYQVGDITVAHFDLYRLETPDAFTEAGFEDYFAGPGLRFVEGPDRAGQRMPTPDWCLTLSEAPAGGRLMTIDAGTPAGVRLLDALTP